MRGARRHLPNSEEAKRGAILGSVGEANGLSVEKLWVISVKHQITARDCRFYKNKRGRT
jgi:hypothetical protein